MSGSSLPKLQFQTTAEMPLSLGDVLDVLKKYPDVQLSQITGTDVFYSDGSLSTAVCKITGNNFSAGVFPDGRLLYLYGRPPTELEKDLQEAVKKTGKN